MRGFPRILQTRADVEAMLVLEPERTREVLRKLLDERMYFDGVGAWTENPDSALARMGIGTAEAVAWIGGEYADPEAPDMTPDMPRLIAEAQRAWELRCQDFVARKGGGDRYTPNHDSAMVDVTLMVMATPEADRTPEMLAAMGLVDSVRAWKRSVAGQYGQTRAAIGAAGTPGGIEAARQAGEDALDALDATDPGVSLADLYALAG